MALRMVAKRQVTGVGSAPTPANDVWKISTFLIGRRYFENFPHTRARKYNLLQRPSSMRSFAMGILTKTLKLVNQVLFMAKMV
jgi:hypothetical protein